MAEEFRNTSSVMIQPINKAIFTIGIYGCPFAAPGYLMRSDGQKLRLTASENIVKAPEMRA